MSRLSIQEVLGMLEEEDNAVGDVFYPGSDEELGFEDSDDDGAEYANGGAYEEGVPDMNMEEGEQDSELETEIGTEQEERDIANGEFLVNTKYVQ